MTSVLPPKVLTAIQRRQKYSGWLVSAIPTILLSAPIWRDPRQGQRKGITTRHFNGPFGMMDVTVDPKGDSRYGAFTQYDLLVLLHIGRLLAEQNRYDITIHADCFARELKGKTVREFDSDALVTSLRRLTGTTISFGAARSDNKIVPYVRDIERILHSTERLDSSRIWHVLISPWWLEHFGMSRFWTLVNYDAVVRLARQNLLSSLPMMSWLSVYRFNHPGQKVGVDRQIEIQLSWFQESFADPGRKGKPRYHNALDPRGAIHKGLSVLERSEIVSIRWPDSPKDDTWKLPLKFQHHAIKDLPRTKTKASGQSTPIPQFKALPKGLAHWPGWRSYLDWPEHLDWSQWAKWSLPWQRKRLGIPQAKMTDARDAASNEAIAVNLLWLRYLVAVRENAELGEHLAAVPANIHEDNWRPVTEFIKRRSHLAAFEPATFFMPSETRGACDLEELWDWHRRELGIPPQQRFPSDKLPDAGRHSYAGPEPRVTSGLPWLDEWLGGGLPRGRVLGICGETGAGKTILAMQMAVQRSMLGQTTCILASDYGNSDRGIRKGYQDRLHAMAGGFGLHDVLGENRDVYLDHARPILSRINIKEMDSKPPPRSLVQLSTDIRGILHPVVIIDHMLPLVEGIRDEQHASGHVGNSATEAFQIVMAACGELARAGAAVVVIHHLQPQEHVCLRESVRQGAPLDHRDFYKRVDIGLALGGQQVDGRHRILAGRSGLTGDVVLRLELRPLGFVLAPDIEIGLHRFLRADGGRSAGPG